MMQDSLARNLRVLRAERGINLTEAEELTGVTRDTIAALEHGTRGAYTNTLQKIADAYDVTLGDLLGEFARVPAGAPGKASAPDTGPSDHLEGTLITYPPRAQEEVVRAYKEGRLSKDGLRKALRDLTDLAIEDAIERLEHDETRAREEVER